MSEQSPLQMIPDSSLHTDAFDNLATLEDLKSYFRGLQVGSRDPKDKGAISPATLDESKPLTLSSPKLEVMNPVSKHWYGIKAQRPA